MLRVRPEVRLEEVLQASNRPRVHQARSRRRVAKMQFGGEDCFDKDRAVEDVLIQPRIQRRQNK